MAPPQTNWARLRADYGCPLRRGAWYRVVSLSPLEAVVDVGRKPVLLPREYLEIVGNRPSRWTVVREVARSPRLPHEMSERYAVCPSCRERMPLRGEPNNLRCRRCNEVFEVGWGERYFDAC